ncbi:MAG: methionyl-tRNA formyltransferase [Clostridiaceae bacterium]|uniref:Methionyl-tRNA formyltransferase n=1 Tax=Hominiventricola aquisgranensis TaxID=3133164 RepID=A0ABV1HZ94_9FIRM|nr:methionyl-tRNA formyltransferase [Clostridiaceae bacterium]MDD5797180.1 methionyl-tRNA formyltransferase [Clostridiaceae bacterium]MDY4546295.1 methionyl-tRNA formyltransferase [Candidatus Choladocola sp.]RHW01489.1 methionyl-tRNA formyltransferase [Clostridiaceae bacterium OF09-1]
MKIIFMGTPDFAVGTLRSLAEAGHEITLVVSQPDKPKGRGHAMVPTPVKVVAEELGIPVFQPVKIREAKDVLEKTEADVCVVAAFGQIIPASILHMKKYGCINVHASLLPKYRGAAPIQWAVIDGEKESGVTIMQMDEGLDTGDMLAKAIVPLDEKETGGSLFDKLSEAGGRLCVETLAKLEKGEITPEKQGESPTAYASMLDKKMGNIDWNKSAVVIERLVRGLNPWPSAYTHLDGKTLKIWACDVLPQSASKGESGEILEVTKDAIHVQTGDGILVLREIQLAGKARMDAGAFLRGYKVVPGTVLSAE